MAKRKRNQPNGLGLEWKHDPTIRSWTTTFTEEKQEKSDYRLQKEKRSQNGLWLGGMRCNRYPHMLQEGYKRGFPFQDKYLVHPNTSPLTGPSIKPFDWESFWMGPYWFFSNNQLCQRVAAFQAKGGPSFVPLCVLLPFSLEETAAPAESKGEEEEEVHYNDVEKSEARQRCRGRTFLKQYVKCYNNQYIFVQMTSEESGLWLAGDSV